MRIFIAFITVLFGLLLNGCTTNLSSYQKQVAIPKAQWDATFQPVFKIDITDTGSAYNMFLIFRHDESYPNSNLWFRLKVKAPGANQFIEGPRIEKELADPEGKWLGKGMSGIWEEKVFLSKNEMPQFNQIGTYEIKVEHLMRTNPLPAVLNVGLRLDKK